MDIRFLTRTKPIDAILRDSGVGENGAGGLRRTLSQWDLTALAIAAIIGAGIFSTIGNAAAQGGPAVSMLFVFTALACSLSAICYAAFAARIPISGSAYTYAYATLGELVAWIIGWDLLMEYSVGNIAVAISWSDYFTNLAHGVGWDVPAWAGMDYLSASRGFEQAAALLASGTVLDQLPAALREAWVAWTTAPSFGGVRLVADLPAFFIVVAITVLVCVGIRESKIANNVMVAIKLLVVVAVIVIGAFFVDTTHWTPFAPHGMGGGLKGVAAVFFAYIGFDAISTTAEECKNPQRDLPRAMIASLLICTALYVAITLVLTGMVPYGELAVGDPLAFVFERVGLPWMSGVVSVSAVVVMAAVLLVFQVGQPRIWMSMSRDGLLPPRFARIHPRFRTPAFSTVVTGVIVAVPSLFMNLTEVTDLTSIGTLFAFVLVCAGALRLDARPDGPTPRFRIPYADSRQWLPLLVVALIAAVLAFVPGALQDLPRTGWPLAIVLIGVGAPAVVRRWSLIPVLGLITNLYLMLQLGVTNWLRFGIWLVVGLCLYFTYGWRHSRLACASSRHSEGA